MTYQVVWTRLGNSGPEAGKGHTSFSKTLTSALAVSHSFFSIQSGGRDLEKKPLQWPV